MSYVYILRNRAMPGLVKIGMTTRKDLRRRVDEISGATGVPVPFSVAYAHPAKKPLELERAVHRALTPYRVSGRREFFRCSVWRAKRAIRVADGRYSPLLGVAKIIALATILVAMIEVMR